MVRKIILDTDIGDDIDDAIALTFACKRPEIELLAVTTCHLCTNERARLAAKQLRLLRADVPYAAGPRLPLTPVGEEERRRFSQKRPIEHAFVKDGEALPPPAAEDAIELMYDVVSRFPGQVALVTIGPLTNAASLLERYPDADEKLECIAMMGGDYPGSKREYNMSADPLASAMVLRSRTVKFMGTWEVTRGVVMADRDLAALRAAEDPACEGLVEQIDLWWPHRGKKAGPVVYDMAPILWSYDPSWFETAEYRIGVLTDGPERGRNVILPDARPVRVSVAMNADGAHDLLMETLLRC